MYEASKALIQRFAEEFVNRGDVSVAQELLSPDFVEHTAQPGVPPTRAGLIASIEALRAAFPDLHSTLAEIVADEEKIAYRGTLTGTHRGFLGPIPPTGRSMRIDEMHIMRVANGQLVEHWGVFDQLGLLQSLGVIPMPEAREPAIA
jgi:predicted ester cyclase